MRVCQPPFRCWTTVTLERPGVWGHETMSRTLGERAVPHPVMTSLVAVRRKAGRSAMAAATEWTFLDGPSKSSAPRC